MKSFERSLKDAMALFHEAYRQSFPAGGDEADHAEATRAGIEAVLVGTPVQCEHCGEWT